MAWDSDFEEVRIRLEHPLDFRNGFWASSLNRLLALAKFVEETKEPLIHFESDVIVASDFPFDDFKQLKSGLAYPVVSEYRGIASTIYIRDRESALLLAQTVISEVRARPDSTDMTILRRIYDLNKDNVSILPSTAEFASSVSPLTPTAVRNSWKGNIEKLHGVFDGADFGYFLLGTDPRNRRGLSLLRTTLPDHYILAKSSSFKFNKERKFVDQEINGQLVPIYTLHATCKSTSLFRFKSTSLLERRVNAQKRKPKTVFAFWAFKYNLISSFRRRIVENGIKS
jgi:hypothetical protein